MWAELGCECGPPLQLRHCATEQKEYIRRDVRRRSADDRARPFVLRRAADDDILSWDWNLRIALDAAAIAPKTPIKGLHYGRDFTIDGRIRAPHELGGKSIKVTLSPFGPKVRFGRGGLQRVGELIAQSSGCGFDFECTLMLPEDAIATTATSLASIWKHVQIHTYDDDPRDVAAYFFAAAIHPNLQAWAGAD